MPKLKNPKHELLAKNIVKEKFNLTKAYQDTYPSASYNSANSQVHTLVKQSPQILSRVEEVANAKGMTLESLIEDLNNLRTSTKPIVINKKIIDYPDYSVRHEVTKTGLKIHGALTDNNTNIDARSVSIQLDPADIVKLAEVTARLEVLSKQIDT